MQDKERARELHRALERNASRYERDIEDDRAEELIEQALREARAEEAMREALETAREALREIEIAAMGVVGADSPIWNHYEPEGRDDEPSAVFGIQFTARAALSAVDKGLQQ